MGGVQCGRVQCGACTVWGGYSVRCVQCGGCTVWGVKQFREFCQNIRLLIEGKI